MDPDSSQIKAETTAVLLRDLRSRLLDLSNRNKLLNFKFSERSRTHVRIIDELPDVLFRRLGEGKSLTFKSLPELEEDEPRDEQSDEFLLALEQARQEDEVYSREVAGLAESAEFTSRLGEVERELKNRLRAKLGMPPRGKDSGLSIEDYARSIGLEPSYDVPKPSTHEQFSAAHTDRFLQTLLLPDAMERRLSGVYENYHTALREKGVNTLFCAFGCLEWLESSSSDRGFFAPLILQPLEMRRELQRGEYRYAITSSGEEPVMNITLAERLRRDFALGLPSLTEEDTPESYMAKMAEIAATKKKWRVRRFITVGHFAFARLVMYQDLDPMRWPKGSELDQHSVISDLLAGTTHDGPIFADEYEIDDPRVENAVPLLIADADSSQHSAIVDVMEGHNRVIEGPPGTGKSQTITNIIAAALAKSKTVLFVAEKMAALEVVKNRLDHVGLGHFCLELHSTKVKKAELLDSLKQRDEIQGRLTPPARLEQKLDELRTVRAQLTNYANTLNRPFGALGKTVQELLWAEQRTRHFDTDLPQRLQQITIKNARDVTEGSVERALEKLRAFQRIHSALSEEFGSPAEHPWSWVSNPQLTPFDVEDLIDALQRWKEAIDGLETGLKDAKSLLPEVTFTTVADIRSNLSWLGQLPIQATNENVCAEMLPHLVSAIARGSIEEFCKDVREFRERLAALAESIADPVKTLDAQLPSLEEALNSTRHVREDILSLPISELKPIAKDCLMWSERYERVGKETTRMLKQASAPDTILANPIALMRIFAALDLLSAAERPWLLLREPATTDEIHSQIIRDAAATSSRLIEEEAELQALFALPKQLDEAVLREHSATLQAAGHFSRFFPRARHAKRYFDRLQRERSKMNRETMSELLTRLADFAGKKREFVTNSRIQTACGKHFYGLQTDFATLTSLIDWIGRVRSELSGNDEIAHTLRKMLLEAPVDSLDAFASLSKDLDLANARELLNGVDSGPDHVSFEEKVAELKRSAARFERLDALFIAAGCKPGIQINRIQAIWDSLKKCHELAQRADGNRVARDIAGESFSGVDTSIRHWSTTVNFASRIIELKPPPELASRIFHPDGLDFLRHLGTFCERVRDSLACVENGIRSIESLAGLKDGAFPGRENWEGLPLTDLVNAARRALSSRESIAHWLDFVRTRQDAEDIGLGPFLRSVDCMQAPLPKLDPAYRRVLYRSCVKQAFEDWPQLAQFSGTKQTDAQERFRRIDREILRLHQQQLAADIASRPVDRGIGFGPKREWTELSLIRNEISKEKRHIPIRDLLQRAGNAVLQMKPCLMMSPMSVAQFLVAGRHQFDLVVVDEASQMRPEDSLGAIARGKQFVVVGDPKQLPPTPFFNRIDDGDSDDEEEAEDMVHSESILDLALSVFRPARRLRWHYRSKHGSLIAFSNRHFYEGKLVVFPSPREQHSEFGVHVVQIEGEYRGRMNIPEVQAVAKAAIDLMHESPEHSLGIATLNQSQRDLLLDEMDRIFARDSKAAEYREKWEGTLEPFFVKNLENVQGDERDVIFISTVYGANESGKLLQRFGPINSRTGHRRLNVLFTRAKERVVVFSSMKPGDIRVDETSSAGVRALRGYLEFAMTGRLEAGESTEREVDSDFEVFVKERLEAAGYEIVPQVGVSGFFIDLGVRNPRASGEFILGIECDGAAYHAGKSARDRDRLRQEVLEGLGWKIYRIWSTDWFRDPRRELKKLLDFLETLSESAH